MAGPVWRAAATDTECLDRSQNQNQARCLRPPRPHRPAPPRQTGRTHPEGAAELGVGSVGSGSEPEPSAADIMATASTSGQSSFGLGKKKKSPGLMDQLSKLFGGEKKKRSKSDSLLLDDFETAQLFMTRPPRRELRARSRRSGDAENKARCPGSSTWEKPSPVLPQNAGAPSSKLSADLHRSDPTGPEQHQAGEAEPQESDPQPQQMLTD